MVVTVTVSTAAVGWGISVAGWLISPIITKLLNKGFSYLGSRSSDKLEELERKVRQLKLMLEAAEANPQRGRLEQWATKLKSAFYKAEDILDEIDYQSLETQGAEIKVSILLRTRLEGTLKEIENLIDEGQGLLSWVKLPATCCNINNTPNNTVRSPTRSTTSTPPVVFGREEDLEMIRRMLRDTPVPGRVRYIVQRLKTLFHCLKKTAADEPSSSRSKCYSVIGIHGIAGSGKTTLAQYVYEKEREDGYFNLLMWIHVSQNFSVDTILDEILVKATKREKVKFSSPDMLETKLKKNLKGKRFFLVLDDFWREGVSKQQLDRLLSPLMVGKMGSKILVTTRFADAARALGAQNPIPMPEMDENQYSLMFMHYARISDQALSSEHELIGKKIAEKLGRSPLAARTVAEQLRGNDINYWKRAMNSDRLNNVTFLRCSYQQLEERVRQCFTYCSMFPRRYELKRDELVHMWMAQGFVDTEDIGHDCFDVLLSCSFIQPKGEGSYFTIHDPVHNFAKRVAGNDCFTFEKGMVDRIPQDVRHLFIESYDETVFREQVLKLKTLRTIFVPFWVQEMTEKDWKKLLMNLKKLRVVHVPGWKGKIPKYIGELKHLRYLSFSGHRIQSILPRTFCKLYHLQKFSASECKVDFSSVKEMISNLVNLQYIETPSLLEFGWDFPNIGSMTGLRTLDVFTVRERRGYEIQQLEHLDNLRGTLRIKGLENVKSKEEARQAKLAEKGHLSKLILSWSIYDQSLTEDDRKSKKAGRTPDPQEDVLEALRPPSLLKSLSIDGYSGSTYPSWLSGKQGTLENLQCLQFSSHNGLNSLPESIEHLASLEELIIHNCEKNLSLPKLPPSLKKLELSNWEGSGAPSGISELFYLRTLEINSCSWNSLPKDMEHLTSLEELIINDCKNILSLPSLPKSLKKLSLSKCNRSLMKSCQTVGHPNRQKIEHIPEKYIF